jgi:copper chaperone CopZ
MKKTAFVLVVPVLALILGFAKPQLAEVVIKTTFYCDHYDQCESKPALEKEIMLTSGVKSVVIDGKANTITVKYHPKRTNPDKIRNVISKAGYDADSLKADPKAVDKLDGCCKKKE